MALTPLHTVEVIEALENFTAQLRPKDETIRKKLDFGYKIEGQSILITEIRPQWNKPEIIREHPVAKATYVKNTDKWKIYWLRANLKWYPYDPVPEVRDIQKFLQVVRDDKHGCFFG